MKYQTDYLGQGIEADIIAEGKFFLKDFHFSYSSINKLLFSPKLFYDHYILKNKEDRLDAHLIEGQLVHLLFLEEEKFEEKFIIVSDKIPTANTKQLIDRLYFAFGSDIKNLEDLADEILLTLQEINLHQTLKTDEQRLDKIITDQTKEYYNFLCIKESKQVIDQDTYNRCKQIADQMKINLEVRESFLLDENVERHHELYLNIPKYQDYNWGLHGYLDSLIIKDGIYYITDIKTFGKSLADFPKTVDYYSYWLQSAIYITLVCKNYNTTLDKIKFSFCVIDKYQQLKCFKIEEEILSAWIEKASETFDKVNWHYSNKDFSLPYDIIHDNISFQ